MEDKDIYGELENGEYFLLTPDWLKCWMEDDIQTHKEVEDD